MANVTWTPNGIFYQADIFNNGNNWSSGTVPGPKDTAIFDASSVTSLEMTNFGSSADIKVGTLQFSSGAPGYTFSGFGQPDVGNTVTLELTGSGIVNDLSTAPSFDLSVQSALIFENGATAGNATISLSPLYRSYSTLQFLNNSTAGQASIINNGGSVDFSQTSGPNGDNKITAGSIAGGGTYDLGPNQLTVGSNNLSTEVGAITGSGSLVKVGTGTLTLSGTSLFFPLPPEGNSYTGGTTISAGTLQLSGSGGSILGDVTDNAIFAIDRSDVYTFGGTISGSGGFQQLGTGSTIFTVSDSYGGGTTISAGTLQLGNGGSSGSLLGDVTDNAIFAIDRSDIFTFANSISGSGGFQQLGTGTTILTADNTFTGATTISAGTLQLGNSGISGSIAGNVTDNASFIIDRSDVYTFAGTITGSGGFQQLGTGTTIFTVSDSYGGGTTISAGTLQLGNGGTSGSIAGNVTDNASFIIDRSDVYNFTGTITGSGLFQQLGTGTTILTAGNPFTGATTISAGTLQLGNGGTSGSIAGNVIDNASFIIDRSDVYTFVGTITGSSKFQQLGTGTTILTADNPFTGATTISTGTLQLGNGGTSGSIAGNVTDNASFIIDRSDVYTFAGTITGSGLFQQLGTGTTILTADNTFTGATTISAGTLQLGNGGTSGSLIGFVLDNGVLAADRSDTLILGNAIFGSGALEQIGTGTTVLAAAGAYAGGTTIAAGTLELGHGGSVFGNVTFADNGAGATLRLDVNATQLGGSTVGALGSGQNASALTVTGFNPNGATTHLDGLAHRHGKNDFLSSPPLRRAPRRYSQHRGRADLQSGTHCTAGNSRRPHLRARHLPLSHRRSRGTARCHFQRSGGPGGRDCRAVGVRQKYARQAHPALVRTGKRARPGRRRRRCYGRHLLATPANGHRAAREHSVQSIGARQYCARGPGHADGAGHRSGHACRRA